MIHIDLGRIKIFIFYSHLKIKQSMSRHKSILSFHNIRLQIYKRGRWNQIM